MTDKQRVAPQKINLAKSTNYRLNLSILPGTQFWLTTCNLPTMSVNEIPIPHPLHGHVYRPGSTIQNAPMTVTFLVDEDYHNYMEILGLMYKAAGPETKMRYKKGEATGHDGSIHILSNNKNVSDKVFTFHNLFPTILGELQMTNESAEPLLTDLTLQYDFMEMASGKPL